MDIGPPELEGSDDEDEEVVEVVSVRSKWLDDNGNHVLKKEHLGTYSPKGLVTELNRKSGAVFMQFFDAKIVMKKGHAGFGACGLHCKAPGCGTILKPNAINQAVAQHGKTCPHWNEVHEAAMITPGQYDHTRSKVMLWLCDSSLIRREEEKSRHRRSGPSSSARSFPSLPQSSLKSSPWLSQVQPARGTGPFGVKSMLMRGGALLRSSRLRC